MNKSAFWISLFMGFSALHAQAPLVTDRPDFTESAVVVPLQSLQIESGVENAAFGSGTLWTYPNTLLRIGLFEKLELRVALPGWAGWESSPTRFQDLGVGFKWQLTPDEATLPVAILAHTTLPVGHETLRGEAGDFDVMLAGAYDFNDRLGLSWNLAAASIKGERGDRLWSQRYSVALGMGLSERLGGYVETMGEFDSSGAWAPLLDGGVTFALSALSQLDAYLGFGLSRHAPDFVVGAGYSIRLFH